MLTLQCWDHKLSLTVRISFSSAIVDSVDIFVDKSHPFSILIGRWERIDIDELGGVPKDDLFSTESSLSVQC